MRFTGDGLTITCGEQDHRSIDGGQIVVPMCDVSGQVHGVQLVRGEKKRPRQGRFLARRPGEEGHFFLIGAITWCCVVAEGYATAASIHEATRLPVAVAFDAGNLAPVAEALKKRYPRAAFIIAADDDYLTEGNPARLPPAPRHSRLAAPGWRRPLTRIAPGRRSPTSTIWPSSKGSSWCARSSRRTWRRMGLPHRRRGRQRRPATIQGAG